MEREIQTVRAKENIPFSEAERIVLSQFIRPGVSFASVIQKTRTVPKPTMTKSSPIGDQLAKKGSSSSKSNPKRRLSGDDRDSSPSPKANRYETLTDEMDADSNEHNDIFYDALSDTDPIMCFSGQVTNASSRVIVRAEIHAPPCSMEPAGAPVGLGESAGAVSLGGPSGTLSSGGSAELPEEPSLGGSAELPGGGGGCLRMAQVGHLERVLWVASVCRLEWYLWLILWNQVAKMGQLEYSLNLAHALFMKIKI